LNEVSNGIVLSHVTHVLFVKFMVKVQVPKTKASPVNKVLKKKRSDIAILRFRNVAPPICHRDITYRFTFHGLRKRYVYPVRIPSRISYSDVLPITRLNSSSPPLRYLRPACWSRNPAFPAAPTSAHLPCFSGERSLLDALLRVLSK
jgi:hypothetical protein